MHQLIDRLREAYEANPMYPEYREGLAEALSLAMTLVAVERAHLKAAWRDGAEGIINQTSEQYFREAYLSGAN